MINPSEITRLRRQLDEGQISAQALAANTLKSLATAGCDSIDSGFVACRAEYAAQRIRQQSARHLTGIPLALSSDIHSSQNSPPSGYDATIVKKLLGYGAVAAASMANPHMAVQKGCVPIAFDPRALWSAMGQRLYALRPSFGVVSRYGVLGPPSLTQVGVIAKSPKDCAIGMDAISDFDPYDPAMVRPNCYDYAERIGQPVRGLRVAREEGAPLDGTALRVTKSVHIGALAWAQPLWNGITLAERYITGEPDAQPVTSAEYARLRSARQTLLTQMTDALGNIDILLLPNTTACIAAVELCGFAAISTPGNLLLVANPYQEAIALQVAHALQMEELL